MEYRQALLRHTLVGGQVEERDASVPVPSCEKMVHLVNLVDFPLVERAGAAVRDVVGNEAVAAVRVDPCGAEDNGVARRLRRSSPEQLTRGEPEGFDVEEVVCEENGDVAFGIGDLLPRCP